MFHVLMLISAGYKNIKVDEHTFQPPHNGIHFMLEGIASILEAKEHLLELKKVEGGGNGFYGRGSAM